MSSFGWKQNAKLLNYGGFFKKFFIFFTQIPFWSREKEFTGQIEFVDFAESNGFQQSAWLFQILD